VTAASPRPTIAARRAVGGDGDAAIRPETSDPRNIPPKKTIREIARPHARVPFGNVV